MVPGHRGQLQRWPDSIRVSACSCTGRLASHVNSAPLAVYQTHRVSESQPANTPALLILIIGEPLICMCSPMIKNLEAKPIVTAPLLLSDGRRRFISR